MGLAEQGDAKAQFNLGVMYVKGYGVKQDYHQAVKWYEKAAEQGDAKAQFNLGVMYENGRGVKQDYHQAFKWYEKAAEQGNAKAQFNLGVMSAKGQGVKQDDYQASKWYEKAAEQGDAKAQFNLDSIFDTKQDLQNIARGITQTYLNNANKNHEFDRQFIDSQNAERQAQDKNLLSYDDNPINWDTDTYSQYLYNKRKGGP